MFLSRIPALVVLAVALVMASVGSASAQSYDGQLYHEADVSLDQYPSKNKKVYKLQGIIENTSALGAFQTFCGRTVLQYRKDGRWRKSAKVDAVQSCSNHPDGSGWLSQFITVRRSIVHTYPYRVKFSFTVRNHTAGQADQGFLTYDLP